MSVMLTEVYNIKNIPLFIKYIMAICHYLYFNSMTKICTNKLSITENNRKIYMYANNILTGNIVTPILFFNSNDPCQILVVLHGKIYLYTDDI